MVATLGLIGVIAYCVGMAWPYFKALIVRDAAVTSWISVTSSLVAGYTTNPLYPGERVGADRRIATVVDPRTSTTDLVRAGAELARAKARLVAQEQVVALARETVEARAAVAVRHAMTFKRDLDTTIEGATGGLAFITQRLELSQAEAARRAALSRAGHSSQSAVDAQQELITEYQRSATQIRTTIARVTDRRHAADANVFLQDDGGDAGAALRSLEDARLRLIQAEGDLASLKVDVDTAQLLVTASRAVYDRALALDITAPPGAMVWSLISAPGAPVLPGAQIASWVDCSIMLVDVPISDVEIALLPRGARAEVLLEGERRVREGTLILTRGAAATIGQHDLAALAKGRRPGLGQALVRLEPTPADLESCPIGHAAHVDFPGVSTLDIVRARLRF